MNGSYQDITKQAEVFALRLKKQFTLPTILWDERLTTKCLDKAQRNSPLKDAQSAKLILADWFAA